MTSQPVPDDGRRHLRLVTQHEHTWELRGVEYDDGMAVREFTCTECDEVTYADG